MGDFRQRRPESGRRPSQPSELRILYDEGALYIGLRLFDREPSRIRRSMGARDAAPDSDWVTIFLDPLLTHQRGYYFQVTAAGVQSDGLIYDQTSLDGSWDAVWSSAVQIDERGWTAELRIPFSSIVFQDSEEQHWGFYVERYVQRSKEVSGWPTIPKDSNLLVALFGELRGLRGLRRPLALRLQPYAALELQLAQRSGSLAAGETVRPNAGLDLRWGAAADLMLAATINPDFGQVEQDPAVVNLSPTEVWFGERRPFFVADSDLFRTPIELLHTRRIGAAPPLPAADEGTTIISLDAAARILGAAKLVGQVGPVQMGALSTLVLPSHAVVEGPAGRSELEASPTSHYGAARLKLRLREARALGLLVTTLNKSGPDATAGGIDWDLRSRSGWQSNGQVSGSTTGDGLGYGLVTQAGQLGAPVWRAWLNLESYSRHYQINDVGYQWRNDMVILRGQLQRRLARPWRALREGYLSLAGAYGFNHSRPSVAFDRRLTLSGWGMFRSLWELWSGVDCRFFTLDDRESRSELPYPRPAEVAAWLGTRTDSSRRLWSDAQLTFSVESGSPLLVGSGSVNASIGHRLSLRLAAAGFWLRGRRRWVQTLSEPARPTRYLFAKADRRELDLRLSGTLVLHPRLTLTASGQLLHSVARHHDPEELVLLDDGRTTLVPTDLSPRADFSATTLLFASILRWDFGGGAAAYVVYRFDGAALTGEASGFDLAGGLGELLGSRQNHLLLFKIAYGWDL